MHISSKYEYIRVVHHGLVYRFICHQIKVGISIIACKAPSRHKKSNIDRRKIKKNGPSHPPKTKKKLFE